KGTNKNVFIENINSTCYVLSSKSEGMPNSLMEAMASGIPSISTNCNFGPSDIINGNNGLLVPVGNSEELYKGIVKIISDEKFRKKISKEGSKMKETNSIESIARIYLDFMLEKHLENDRGK